jgi:hypothetical protein
MPRMERLVVHLGRQKERSLLDREAQMYHEILRSRNYGNMAYAPHQRAQADL